MYLSVGRGERYALLSRRQHVPHPEQVVLIKRGIIYIYLLYSIFFFTGITERPEQLYFPSKQASRETGFLKVKSSRDLKGREIQTLPESQVALLQHIPGAVFDLRSSPLRLKKPRT